ncbi:helix-turn-helix domain-containing protein [Providencia alcalifaciens]|uniref:helix-turn-helix domain-containing protein n=1 Tax=Providencia alcalifaciens TaxID=126385 RepID=UPI0003E2A6AC|nr:MULTISPECIES: helix-turn-helix domain-containing protein [Providencia]ETS98697.1 transcriptional regulator, Fis family [Providencia alcalifaciens PAL-3]EUC97771.1 transcriptional regulator, Fis family [Providencia alcalifaciens PAL-1]MBG5883093.1 transcriptional regulator [Providencia alcalifaciens]MBS0924962.1 transcriptional regulator [Providencia sp. JGM181]MBS0934802.1 transcriptional regulator [Providencia sp. JGM172]
MTIDFTIPKLAQLTEKSSCSIDPELLIQLASEAITNGLSPIHDFDIEGMLLDKYGQTLWSNRKSDSSAMLPSWIFSQIQVTSLDDQPINSQGHTYYFAPIYDETRLLATLVLRGESTSSNILLALTLTLGREISEKLKCHFYWQKLSEKTHGHNLFHDLNIHEVEKALIIEAALAYGGKIQEMHQALNMGRTTLWRKLKQYQIDIREYKL